MGGGRRTIRSTCSPTHNTTPLSKRALSRQTTRRSRAVAKKQRPKKTSLEEAVALLRHRYRGRLAPPLEGLAYRFTVWLPIQAQSLSDKPVGQAASLS